MTASILLGKMPAMGARLICGFAIALAVFTLAPALLSQPLSVGSVLRWGDLVDLLAPLVIVSGYYLLFRSADDWAAEPATGWMIALFLFTALLLVDGHGLHLAAKAIARFVTDGAAPVSTATDFYQSLSHSMEDGGRWGLALLLLWRHYQPVKKGVDLWNLDVYRNLVIVSSALIYGLTISVTAVQMHTLPFDLSAAAATTVLFGIFWWRQRRLPGAPVFTFLGLGAVTVTVLLAVYGLYDSILPQIDLGMAG